MKIDIWIYSHQFFKLALNWNFMKSCSFIGYTQTHTQTHRITLTHSRESESIFFFDFLPINGTPPYFMIDFRKKRNALVFILLD